MSATRSDRRIRLPKTINECRHYETIIEDDYNEYEIEVRIHIRGKRLPKSLPNSWDDIFRKDRYDINWKNAGRKNRKKQWMKK